MAVGSIVGGNPEGDIGIGRTANATAASIKPQQRMANDNLFFLDETNIIDKNVEHSLRLFFDHTSGQERSRHGDEVRTQTIRNTLLMTGNERLVDRAKVPAPILEAAKSRCLSIDVGKMVFEGDGITASDNTRMLIELRIMTNQFYGSAGRAFVQKIIDECEADQARFDAKVSRFLANFDRFIPPMPNVPNRIRTTIGLSYTAGMLAKSWGLFPCGNKARIRVACNMVHRDAVRQVQLDLIVKSGAARRVLKIIKDNSNNIPVCVKSSRHRKATHNSALGYRVNDDTGNVRFFFEERLLKRLLGGSAVSDLKELRSDGFLKGEGVESTRLKNKMPAYIPIGPRGFELVFPSELFV